MSTRRDFLARLVRSAAGLYVADDALEVLLEQRRKLWPGWSPDPTWGRSELVCSMSWSNGAEWSKWTPWQGGITIPNYRDGNVLIRTRWNTELVESS